MKFAIVACLILTPLVAARYIESVLDEKRSSEIDYQKESPSVIKFDLSGLMRGLKKNKPESYDKLRKIFNSKRDDDVKAIEKKNKVKISPISREVYLQIAKRYEVLYEMFYMTHLDLGEILCGTPDKALEDAVKANKDLYAAYKSFIALMKKHNIDPQDMLCY